MAKKEAKAAWFKLFERNLCLMQAMSEEAVGRAVMAALVHLQTGEPQQLQGTERLLYAMLEPQVEEALEDYAAAVQRARRAAERRWKKEGISPLSTVIRVDAEEEEEIEEDADAEAEAAC